GLERSPDLDTLGRSKGDHASSLPDRKDGPLPAGTGPVDEIVQRGGTMVRDLLLIGTAPPLGFDVRPRRLATVPREGAHQRVLVGRAVEEIVAGFRPSGKDSHPALA